LFSFYLIIIRNNNLFSFKINDLADNLNYLLDNLLANHSQRITQPTDLIRYLFTDSEIIQCFQWGCVDCSLLSDIGYRISTALRLP